MWCLNQDNVQLLLNELGFGLIHHQEDPDLLKQSAPDSGSVSACLRRGGIDYCMLMEVIFAGIFMSLENIVNSAAGNCQSLNAT